jgi:hypothetical protein
MSKSTFGINTDSSWQEFVYQKGDEFDKKIIVIVQHLVILLEREGCDCCSTNGIIRISK